MFCLSFQVLPRYFFILGVILCSPKFLVSMSANCRPPSHQSILWIFQFYPFLTKCTLLAICLVCLVSLPFLSIQTADLLSNIVRGASYGTTYESLFKNSWIYILKCAKVIPEVHAALYQISAPDWSTGPVTGVPCSILPPW